MVAELRIEAATLPLLLEPDQPTGRRTRGTGWRRKGGLLIRNYLDDAEGALVQHVIVRYYVHGYARSEISREIQYSTRHTQSWISGSAHANYAQPVRRALSDIGLDLSCRNHGRSMVEPASVRLRDVIRACMGLISEMHPLMPQWPHTQDIRQTARLLTAGREPLGPVS